jgi:hypothetical protein
VVGTYPGVKVLAAALVLLAAPPLVDRVGTWTLSQLGAGSGIHHVPAQTGLAFRWRGPAGLRQGRHGRWYFVRFHARLPLDVRRKTFESIADIESSSGPQAEYVCASDLVHEFFASGTFIYRWFSGAGALEVAGTAAQPVLLIDDTTACTGLGIRGGTNTVRLRATGFGEHARLAVLPDSGLVVRGLPTPGRPERPLLLQLRPPTKLESGSAASFRVVVAGAGTPLQGGSLVVTVPSGPLRMVGPTSMTLPQRPANVLVARTFRVRAVRPGTSWILVRAGAERALALVTIH